MRRILMVAPLALALVMIGGVFLPRSWFYPQHRPTSLGRLTNRFMSWWACLGRTLPGIVTLEVKGRRTGRLCSTVLVVAEHNGQRYLVSMLGERSEWVRNVRAAHGAAVLRHGAREHVRLEEVPASQRAPILKAYLHRADRARWHFAVGHGASPEEFERIAAGYPVFRIVSAAG